ncbi:hypothetical protein GW915_04910 [bacterium]|nr:hypothetical protein [bacterium]
MVEKQNSLAHKLMGAYDRGRLGHALILKVLGPHQLDAQHNDFYSILETLQCSQRSTGEMSCGTCDSCRLLRLRRNDPEIAHPDAFWLEPKNENGYAVEQIRELSRFLSLKGNLSANRVIWINQAEKLFASQGAAANALLKILEEPRPNCFLLLTSKQPELLMATIRSRCHQYVLEAQSSEALEISQEWSELESWIKAGAPEKAPFACPCDEESFWKDRKKALEEISMIQGLLWQNSKGLFHQFDHQQARRVLDFFKGLERFVLSLRSYSNATLQWLNFKIEARQGLLWKQ